MAKNLYPIVQQSALEFWRDAKNIKYLKLLVVKKRKIVDLPKNYTCPASAKAAEKIQKELKLNYPIYFMQPSTNYFRCTEFARSAVRPKALPPNSFVQIAGNVIVASPEYCFLSFANKLPFEKLVELANNLCAKYFFDASAGHGQSSFSPVCSVACIADYLQKVKNYSGIKKAREAIKYASDNSNSPRESMLAAIYRIPKVRGGCGLRKLTMNYDVPLSKDAAKLVKRESLEVDIIWLEEKVIVEYDSDETHLESNQHAFDKAKINALNASGYRVITITKKDLQNLQTFDAATDTIRKALGMRSNRKELEKYKERRQEVFQSLFYNVEHKPKKKKEAKHVPRKENA